MGRLQITYLVTKTNMFAAVQAGASVSNMMLSAYGGIRWGTGMSRVPVREDAVAHRRAAVGRATADSSRTPHLLGQEGPDAVLDPQRRGRCRPLGAGIRWINALRRLGKEGYCSA